MMMYDGNEREYEENLWFVIALLQGGPKPVCRPNCCVWWCRNSGVFMISERGRSAKVVGYARGLGRNPEILFYPQNNNFWCILTRSFISYKCNNRVQNQFSVPHDLLRVFEDDNTTNYYTVN